jgi:hypothetical protein
MPPGSRNHCRGETAANGFDDAGSVLQEAEVHRRGRTHAFVQPDAVSAGFGAPVTSLAAMALRSLQARM